MKKLDITRVIISLLQILILCIIFYLCTTDKVVTIYNDGQFIIRGRVDYTIEILALWGIDTFFAILSILLNLFENHIKIV